jgi:hypothetical protein
MLIPSEEKHTLEMDKKLELKEFRNKSIQRTAHGGR